LIAFRRSNQPEPARANIISTWYTDRSIVCDPVNLGGNASLGFLQCALPFCLGEGTPFTKTDCVKALWGKLLGMAVTKCIGLQEVESAVTKKASKQAF
jgi:hypothetical protein